MKTTLEIYGQYLLNTHINYTNLADHAEELSHDSVHRFLKGSKLSPRMVWDRVKDQIVFSQSGCVIFDDTVRSAFSSDRSKKKRKVDETGGAMPYVQVCQLDWPEQDLAEGKTVKLHGFPMDRKVKLFRVAVSSDRTEHLVTNDCTQTSTAAARLECAQRWKIEQFHRAEKQLTGIAKCPCRKNRSQRNHSCAAVLVWVRLNELKHHAKMTVYQIKQQLLDDYLFLQMAKPSIAFK